MGTNNIDNEDEELFVTITLEDDSAPRTRRFSSGSVWG